MHHLKPYKRYRQEICCKYIIKCNYKRMSKRIIPKKLRRINQLKCLLSLIEMLRIWKLIRHLRGHAKRGNKGWRRRLNHSHKLRPLVKSNILILPPKDHSMNLARTIHDDLEIGMDLFKLMRVRLG